MDLHVTVTGGPGVAPRAEDIVVDTDVITSGAALAVRLEASGWPAPFSVDGVPLAALEYPRTLHDGALILAGTSSEPPERTPMSHLLLVVHTGPDAGQVIPLTRGSYSIGRADADILIADPGLSRPHARLTVSSDAIVLEDLDSTNGTFVDGEPVTRAEVTVSADIRLGASHCSIHLLDGPAWVGADAASVLEAVPVAPALPRKPSRVLLLTALLPLVLGVVLALTTGMWFFLAFSGLSAVTGLVPLLSYRRAAKIFAAAVDVAAEEDRRRRTLSAPDPGSTALDALRQLHAPMRAVPEDAAGPSVVLLRLGTADQPSNLAVRRNDEDFLPPELPAVPLLINCSGRSGGAGDPDLVIYGDARRVQSLARALLLQLAHPGGSLPRVLCWGFVEDMPKSARFLPNVTLTRDPKVLELHAEQSGTCIVFQFSRDLPLRLPDAGLFVVRIAPGGGTFAAPHVVRMTGGGGEAGIGPDVFTLEPDAVTERTFSRTARLLARSAHRASLSGGYRPSTSTDDTAPPPVSVSLWSASRDAADLAARTPPIWRSSDPTHPTARLGSSGQGPVLLDLVDDGPHLLITGTTGSGKSELLRTLVLGLAMGQPPPQLTLLLIDYKGGAGLGELAALPHCVGSMSDLSSESTARAFVSLRAELRRRETMCAEHGARDIDHLRSIAPTSCPSRLVVVIDEFRALIDDVPEAMPDLVKIAALGRSLGVHLVLATQKAQGAVPADMRANITSTVLLRVRTALDSQDLLGSALAADIPVDLPGRAYLRRGNGVPVEFQVASSSTPASAGESQGWQSLSDHVDGAPITDSRTLPSDVSPDLLGTAVSALVVAADRYGAARPERPVLPPLPDRLTPRHCSELLPAGHAARTAGPEGRDGDVPDESSVDLGVMDLPHHQQQRVLRWIPSRHSHLAVIGLPGSGGSEALSALVSALPGADPDVHLYLLDGDGSFDHLHGSVGDDDPIRHRLGALVEPQETKRAARVLERLAGLTSSRENQRRIVLAITGWGRWVSQFRGIRGCQAEEDLHALIRDGALTGVTVLILGDREVTGARFYSSIPNRVYLPLGAHQEMTLTWPRLPPMDAIAGRAFSQGRINGPYGDSVCQLLLEAPEDVKPRRPRAAPFPVLALPAVVPLSALEGLTELSDDRFVLDRSREDLFPLGVHGDDLEPYSILLQPGQVFLVLGHPSSGRTNTLRVLSSATPMRTGRRRTIAPPWNASASERTDFWRSLADQRPSAIELTRSILLVDDAERLPADVQRVLTELVGGGASAVLAARPSPSLMARVPLTLQARSAGHGLILSPRTATDGDLLAVRVDVDGAPVPGRGYAVDPSGPVEIQTALAPVNRDHAVVSAASAGPRATAFYRCPSAAP